MPIYECSCQPCRITFEILAPVSEANRKHPCPRCERPSRRVPSSFAIGAVGVRADRETAEAAHGMPGNAPVGHHHAGHGNPRRRGQPAVPNPARLCWMDDRSAERFAAYKLGRGTEYDDKSAAKVEWLKKRGLPAPPARDQTNSPVARMVARKKAEQAKKAAQADAPSPSPR